MVHRIRFVRHAKELGFTLREIKELLELRVESDCRYEKVLALAKARIDDIEQRVRKLQRMKPALSALARDCRQGRPSDDCPIFKALDRTEGQC
ncbi:MAG: MerR family DNA-binding protein [Planctomycetes bacterium]|nr:MerR family DNA-binding protein [Planctomycetota bacterium]